MRPAEDFLIIQLSNSRAKEADIEKLPDNELILNKVIWVCNSQS